MSPGSATAASSSTTATGVHALLRHGAVDGREHRRVVGVRPDRPGVERVEVLRRELGGSGREARARRSRHSRASGGLEQPLEPLGVLERADHCQLELPADDVLGDALDVLRGDRVEALEHCLGLLGLAEQHLAPEPVHDRAVGALDPEHEPALRERARLLELAVGTGSSAIRRSSEAIVVTASSMRWMSTPAWA